MTGLKLSRLFFLNAAYTILDYEAVKSDA